MHIAQSSETIEESVEVEPSNEAFVLALPGKCLDVSHLVNKRKKFCNKWERGCTSGNEKFARKRNRNLARKKGNGFCKG